MPRQDRQLLVDEIYQSLIPGGAFIFAEKTLASNSLIQEMRTFTYYDFKRQSFSYDDIMTKEKKLRSMLKANTRDELIDMCVEAGFNKNSIDTFWQNYAFTGFIAIKD
jgi:tRNA (cmo5U34)-methyltransferase